MHRKFKKALSVIRHPVLITCKTKYIFLLSHMRSRSSVLSHILGSNSEICGYYELHMKYSAYRSIIYMRQKLYGEFHREINGKYLFDKILHNRHFISEKLIEVMKPKFIFLLRGPKSTIMSMLSMGITTNRPWYKYPEAALEYYCSRLKYLEEFAQRIDNNYFYIDSDDLVDQSDITLGSLTAWLKLNAPLTKYYTLFRYSGDRGVGDSSDHIKTGVMGRTADRPQINVPKGILIKARQRYERCQHILISDSANKSRRLTTNKGKKDIRSGKRPNHR